VLSVLAVAGFPDKPAVTITPKFTVALGDAIDSGGLKLRLAPTPTEEFETTVKRVSIAVSHKEAVLLIGLPARLVALSLIWCSLYLPDQARAAHSPPRAYQRGQP